jgi:hypothetical protein
VYDGDPVYPSNPRERHITVASFAVSDELHTTPHAALEFGRSWNCT